MYNGVALYVENFILSSHNIKGHKLYAQISILTKTNVIKRAGTVGAKIQSEVALVLLICEIVCCM